MTSVINDELIKKSPLRLLEKSISGGLGAGCIGVLASPKGVGKTACLVHIACDKLLQETPVIHISYANRVDYIINWYEDIFKELAKKPGLKGILGVYDEIIKRRVIMNFKQDGARTEQVLKSLEAMITCGKIAARTVIVDGFDFSQARPDELKQFKDLAAKLKLEIWFSASLHDREPLYDENGIPHLLQDFIGIIDVLLTLQHHGSHVHLTLIKDHDKLAPRDVRLKLDPKTLLIVKELKRVN